jgi:hypothetical protein
MRGIIGCESSGIVREAFRARGHDVYSCDLLPSKTPSPYHIQGNILDFLNEGWDFMIVHPPCTYLTVSAAWAFGDGPYHQKVKPGTLVGAARREAQKEAIEFALALWNAPIKKKCLENPIGALSKYLGKASQIIQPHDFGEDASKATCLWLEGLPLLKSTSYYPPRIVNGKPRWGNQTDSGQNRLSPGADRWQKRSETFQGVADAMAEQWGKPTFTQPYFDFLEVSTYA